ncbi:hypothetical protein CsSME_00022271 [Camellia sinensis var. sinensis]
MGLLWQAGSLLKSRGRDMGHLQRTNHTLPKRLQRSLIEDARFLLRRSNSSLGHTLRERNKAVDRLANMGVAQNEHVVFLDNPPIEVTTFLIDDMTGVSFVRD